MSIIADCHKLKYSLLIGQSVGPALGELLSAVKMARENLNDIFNNPIV